MREILFRGKRKGTGEWVYGFYAPYRTIVKTVQHRIYTGEADKVDGQLDFYPDFYPDFYNVIPETVGQYTGLKDVHGTRIFEKDIVRIYYPFDDPDGCVVSWSKEGARWDFGGCDAYFCTPSKNCEVIGNVYDDVNLLET